MHDRDNVLKQGAKVVEVLNSGTSLPSGPLPLIWSVTLSPSPLSALPIMETPASARPSAAVATGVVWWMLRARSVSARVLTAAALTEPSFEMARTIQSFIKQITF